MKSTPHTPTVQTVSVKKVPLERFTQDLSYTAHVVEATHYIYIYMTVPRPSPMSLSLVIVEEGQLSPAVAEERIGKPGMVQVVNHG